MVKTDDQKEALKKAKYILKKTMLSAIPKMKTTSFTNGYGERFNIHSNGVNVYMSGDEVDAMVDDKYKIGKYLSLFNQGFDVWSHDELYKLGEALVELHKP